MYIKQNTISADESEPKHTAVFAYIWHNLIFNVLLNILYRGLYIYILYVLPANRHTHMRR